MQRNEFWYEVPNFVSKFANWLSTSFSTSEVPNKRRNPIVKRFLKRTVTRHFLRMSLIWRPFLWCIQGINRCILKKDVYTTFTASHNRRGASSSGIIFVCFYPFYYLGARGVVYKLLLFSCYISAFWSMREPEFWQFFGNVVRGGGGGELQGGQVVKASGLRSGGSAIADKAVETIK